MSISRRHILAGGGMLAVAVVAPTAGAVPRKIGRRGITLACGNAVLTREARPSLVWRYVGEQEWRVNVADTIKVSKKSGAILVVAEFGPMLAEFEVGVDGPKWTFSGLLRHTGDEPVQLQRFNYLTGMPADATVGLIAPQTLQGTRYYPPGARVKAQNPDLSELWAGMRVTWGVAPDPVWSVENWGLSRDLGIFTTGWDQPGWTAAFTGPGVAFGEIGLHTGDTPRLFVGQLLDGIVIDPAEKRTLESATIRYGEWQAAMADWVADTAEEITPRPLSRPAAGFCSWYQFGQKVTAEEIAQATREMMDFPKVPGGRLVQIDDGYQTAMGDWSPNAKFAKIWDGLPAKIRETGSVPGAYLAPTLVSEKLPIIVANPEWVQRAPDGTPAIVYSNWAGRTVAIDPDHPGALAFMRGPFEQRRAEGWDYIKVDFTYSIAPNRVLSRLKRTSFESQRAIYAMIRDAVGQDMRINSCVGEPARYSIGLVDACRIYGDIGTKWATVQGNLLPLLLHSITGRRWYNADPDVFYMRQVKTNLTDEENWLLTGSIGLMGGLFLTSDFPSQWSERSRARIARFWDSEGPRTPVSQHIIFGAEGTPLAYRVSYPDGAIRHRIGIYNWADEQRDTEVSLSAAGLPPGLRAALAPGGDGIALVGNKIGVKAQPAHSLRIADLR